MWLFASMPADRALASQRVGKEPKPIPASLWDIPARKHGKALSRMASRQNRVRDQASHSRKQQTARPHSVHWWLSHQRPVRVGPHCQARCDYHPWRQCSLLRDSGGVVNSLDFCPASLKSLGCLYFQCVLSGDDSEFANFSLPTLKAFLEAHSHNVFGNKQ